jgi:hypothetical protein
MKLYEHDCPTLGTFLLGLLQIGTVYRHRHETRRTSSRHRQETIWYSVPNGRGDPVPVWKSTSTDVSAVDKKQLQVLVSKKKAGETSFTDECTRYAPGRFTEDRNSIRNHINSFSREISHYTTARSNKQYLDRLKNKQTTVFTIQKADP